MNSLSMEGVWATRTTLWMRKSVCRDVALRVRSHPWATTKSNCLSWYVCVCVGRRRHRAREIHTNDYTALFFSPAVCRLPMVAQPCTGQPPIWAFDSTAGLCVAYKPGFCQANGNKFYSKAECEEYCGVVKEGDELANRNTRGLQL